MVWMDRAFLLLESATSYHGIVYPRLEVLPVFPVAMNAGVVVWCVILSPVPVGKFKDFFKEKSRGVSGKSTRSVPTVNIPTTSKQKCDFLYRYRDLIMIIVIQYIICRLQECVRVVLYVCMISSVDRLRL
mmetsp:Transcript_8226/g.23552  ORF Transcript_8226/g.23552 Transcript_8226/m.23552 type:complete len:130 (-) Transcript_8226:28-417(-)